MTFNIYVISYNRAETACSHNLVEYCTYVVRDSQREMYEVLGCPILSALDSEIDSLVKVQNWLIDNAEEDVICILDDDIHCFSYLTPDGAVKLCQEDKETITSEIERIAQIAYDLNIGLATDTGLKNPLRYQEPFRFVCPPGSVKIINRLACKSRYDDIAFWSDVDFQLQELLRNRIILVPCYFTDENDVDVNAGGSNVVKSLTIRDVAMERMKQKWGKYFEKVQESQRGTLGRINVKR